MLLLLVKLTGSPAFMPRTCFKLFSLLILLGKKTCFTATKNTNTPSRPTVGPANLSTRLLAPECRRRTHARTRRGQCDKSLRRRAGLEALFVRTQVRRQKDKVETAHMQTRVCVPSTNERVSQNVYPFRKQTLDGTRGSVLRTDRA